jgi:hypothetical protein
MKKVAIIATAATLSIIGVSQAETTDWDAAACGIVDPKSNVATWFNGRNQGQAVYKDVGRIVWTSKTGPIPVFVKRMVTRMEGREIRIRCVSA